MPLLSQLPRRAAFSDFWRARLFFSVLLCAALFGGVGCKSSSQNNNTMPTAPKQPAAFDGSRAFAHVRKQVEFGPRPAGSAELAQTRAYIVSELQSYGLKVTQQEFTAATPQGPKQMVNITAELAGATSDRVIMLASHYDTKFMPKFRFVGANDGGSSTGVLLELARVLASHPQPRLTHWFTFFDGEEAFCMEWDQCRTPDGGPDNTYGSRYFVAQLKASGTLKRMNALVLLDLVGYREPSFQREDTSTQWLTETVWATAKELGHGTLFLDEAVGVTDDHTPFLEAGADAMNIIQLDSYPYWHTKDDTLDKISPRTLKIVGDVVLASLPKIEAKLLGATATGTPTPGEALFIQDKNFEGVIFSPEMTAKQLKVSAAETWMPAREDIVKLEDGVKAFLRGSSKSEPRAETHILPRFLQFRRQYFGVTENGQKVIHAYFFCDAQGINWKTALVQVEDGGPCYFNLRFAPQSGKFERLQVNGEG